MADYQKENLLIKTFEAESAEKIDSDINEFRKKSEIRFTTPLVNYIVTDSNKIKKYFTYVVYYVVKSQSANQQEPTKIETRLKKCLGCGEMIPESFDFHLKCKWKAV